MKELLNILAMTDREIGGYLKVELKKFFKKIITDNDNYLYCKGTAPVCLVAHIDTCRGKTDNPCKLTVSRNVIRNVNGILGADDRAGVFGILEVLRELKEGDKPLPSVIFTNYEESGGRGIKEFIKTEKFDPRGINLMIELDRKGCNEYVFYSTHLPVPVKSYVESFGFREERGSYSDISDLTDTYEIPSVNLSIGYYAQHTARESLHYDELMLTVDRVVEMCDDTLKFLYKIPAPTWKKQRYGTFNRDYEDFYGVDKHGSTYGTGKKSNVVTHVKPLTKEEKDIKLIEQEIATTVFELIKERKEDILEALLTTWGVDALAVEYFNHQYNVQIIDMLGEVEATFMLNLNSPMAARPAFYRAWNYIIEEPCNKLYVETKKIITV